MTTFIALLCAVNVGGRGKLSMEELRTGMLKAGYRDVRTVLQSGNVIFKADSRGGAPLEHALEDLLAGRHGVQTDVIIRTAAEWAAIVAANPFPVAAADDPSHLLVMPLKGPPAAAAVTALKAAIVGRESIAAVGRDLYITYPDGIGESKLTNALVYKKLGVRGTGRNWNTVRRLGELSAG